MLLLYTLVMGIGMRRIRLRMRLTVIIPMKLHIPTGPFQEIVKIEYTHEMGSVSSFAEEQGASEYFIHPLSTVQ